MAGKIFDEMFIDDPSGGPSQTNMYLALRRALKSLEGPLEANGINIVSAGFRRGFRLKISSTKGQPYARS